MFKGAYTDDFYRSVRNLLHAEVDSWKAGSAEVTPIEYEEAWRQIELREPRSRNSDATPLWDSTAVCPGPAERNSKTLVSVNNATLATELSK